MRDYQVLTPGHVWMVVGELPQEHLAPLITALEKRSPESQVPSNGGAPLTAGALLDRARIEVLIREMHL